MVAAPEFPLTSREAHTRIAAADVSDAPEQVRDVSFVIDSLLAEDELSPMIDADRIALVGHSLGGVTAYFATYGMQCRDPRIKASIPGAASDPVASALANGLGFAGIQHAPIPVPVLFLSAEKDLFARMAGRPGAAFARVEPPKHHVMIARGTHVWFHDGDDQPADHRNPDCLWFDAYLPGVSIPGSEERVPLIGAARQQQIAASAIVDFLDGYLRNDRQTGSDQRDLSRSDDRNFALKGRLRLQSSTAAPATGRRLQGTAATTSRGYGPAVRFAGARKRRCATRRHKESRKAARSSPRRESEP
jgi:predicted dienelactone hydrolase